MFFISSPCLVFFNISFPTNGSNFLCTLLSSVLKLVAPEGVASCAVSGKKKKKKSAFGI